MSQLHKCYSLPNKLSKDGRKASRNEIHFQKLAQSAGNLELRRDHVSRIYAFYLVISVHTSLASIHYVIHYIWFIYRQPGWDLHLNGIELQSSERELGELEFILCAIVLAKLRMEHVGSDSRLRSASLSVLEQISGGSAVRLGMHQLSHLLRTLLLVSLQNG